MPEPGNDAMFAASQAARRVVVTRIHHRQPQRLPVQPAAQHDGFAAADTQLAADVGDDTVVGGGGGRQHRDALAEFGDQRPDAPVVGAEVVAPIGHAMRLVDDDEPGVTSQRGQHTVAEIRIVEPFRADQ